MKYNRKSMKDKEKTSLKFQNNSILQNRFSDYNRLKLKIKKNRLSRKLPDIKKLSGLPQWLRW